MRKYLTITALVLAITKLGTYSANAGVFYNGSEYFLTSNSSTWTQAQAEAESFGGNLVTINSAEENQFLVDTFGDSVEEVDNLYWIGLNDVANEGTFEWISGEPVTYTNWHPGEPNNQGDEDYTVMNWVLNSNWNDLTNNGFGTSPIYGIVERAVPEPLTILGAGTAIAFGTGFKRKLAKAKKK